MQVKKAVITAAGRASRQKSTSDAAQKAMLPIVDRDGLTKPVLQIIAEEAMASGIEEVCIVAAPEDEAYYRRHFASQAETLLAGSKDAVWAEEQARRIDRIRAPRPLRRAGRAPRLRPRRLVRP